MEISGVSCVMLTIDPGEVLEVVSNYNQTQLQSTTAQFKNRTDGPAEVLLRP